MLNYCEKLPEYWEAGDAEEAIQYFVGTQARTTDKNLITTTPSQIFYGTIPQ